MVGKIHPPRTLFLREQVGSATDPETGVEYEMTTQVGNRCPIIHNKETGNYFTLSWQDIINLAVEAGIDKEITNDD